MERRRIVDAVTEISDDVSRAFSARMIRFFCTGDTRANTVVCSATCAESRVVRLVEFVAENNTSGFEAHPSQM